MTKNEQQPLGIVIANTIKEASWRAFYEGYMAAFADANNDEHLRDGVEEQVKEMWEEYWETDEDSREICEMLKRMATEK